MFSLNALRKPNISYFYVRTWVFLSSVYQSHYVPFTAINLTLLPNNRNHAVQTCHYTPLSYCMFFQNVGRPNLKRMWPLIKSTCKCIHYCSLQRCATLNHIISQILSLHWTLLAAVQAPHCRRIPDILQINSPKEAHYSLFGLVTLNCSIN